MDVYDAMAARKTIRDFLDREIAIELVLKLISAGLNAPTNNHLREWHFVLLQEKSKRKQLFDEVIHPVSRKGAIGVINRWGLKDESQREMYVDAIPRQYDMLYRAGCLIIPCFCQPESLLHPMDISALNPFASIWCCIENILIAAASEGIFGVTRIPFEEERKTLKQFLAIPSDYEVPCYIALGYPSEKAERTKQVEINLPDRIHYNNW